MWVCNGHRRLDSPSPFLGLDVSNECRQIPFATKQHVQRAFTATHCLPRVLLHYRILDLVHGQLLVYVFAGQQLTQHLRREGFPV